MRFMTTFFEPKDLQILAKHLPSADWSGDVTPTDKTGAYGANIVARNRGSKRVKELLHGYLRELEEGGRE